MSPSLSPTTLTSAQKLNSIIAHIDALDLNNEESTQLWMHIMIKQQKAKQVEREQELRDVVKSAMQDLITKDDIKDHAKKFAAEFKKWYTEERPREVEEQRRLRNESRRKAEEYDVTRFLFRRDMLHESQK